VHQHEQAENWNDGEPLKVHAGDHLPTVD
jgi:hypothetical protein